MSFRLRNFRQLSGRVEIRLPEDEEGFLGRECPIAACLRYFKIKLGTGLTGDNLPCVCPYCGHSGPQDTFFTQDQLAFGKSVVQRKAVEALRADLKGLEFNRPARGPLGIGISMRLKPGLTPSVKY